MLKQWSSVDSMASRMTNPIRASSMRTSLPAVLLYGLFYVAASILPWGVAHAGDVEAGKALADQSCVACHGPDGNSLAPNFPNLAGQIEGYFIDQLKKIKSNVRPIPEMTAFVADLTPEDMQNLAAFYAAQPAKQTSIGEADLDMAERGQSLYRGGYKDMRIAACMSCHGPSGHGVPQLFPRVANQQREYLKKQLMAYKDGSRVSDGDIMNEIAFRMSEQQIDDVSAYMHALK